MTDTPPHPPGSRPPASAGSATDGAVVVPDPITYAWLAALAGREHGGDVGAAAAAVLYTARVAAIGPDGDPWAHITAELTAKNARR